jgi:hypothetical protein
MFVSYLGWPIARQEWQVDSHEYYGPKPFNSITIATIRPKIP